MEFLNFFAQRLNVSPGEAHRLLEQTLDNYRPARDYSTRMHELRDTNEVPEPCESAPDSWASPQVSARQGSAPRAAHALRTHRNGSPQADRAPVPRINHAYLEQ